MVKEKICTISLALRKKNEIKGRNWIVVGALDTMVFSAVCMPGPPPHLIGNNVTF